MPKKGTLVSAVQIIDLIPGGEARGNAVDEAGLLFAIHFDARTVAPGDRVTARLLGKHDGRWQGRVESREDSATLRRSPACPHFGICGGCTLQHLPYSQQLALKEGIVRTCLGDLSAAVDWQPTLGCDMNREFAFRNKMEFTASARPYQVDPNFPNAEGPGAIGLFVPFCGNKVLDITDCRLQADIGNQIRNWLRLWATTKNLSYYHSTRHDGFLRTLLIRTNLTGQALVMFIVAEDNPDLINSLCQEFSRQFPQAKSIWYLINTKLNDSYADLTPIHYSGERYITEKLGNLNFSVGPLTFLQVNSAQTTILYQRILELAQLKGTETVYDLYCGVGTISAWLASHAKQVIGIEYVESAIIAARQTCQENRLENCKFFSGDMKDILVKDFFATQGIPDVIITDPPRAGMHPRALQVLVDSGAHRIVYVSCNPVSLARDLAVLTKTYQLKLIQAIDLMPQSHHIETLAVLELR